MNSDFMLGTERETSGVPVGDQRETNEITLHELDGFQIGEQLPNDLVAMGSNVWVSLESHAGIGRTSRQMPQRENTEAERKEILRTLAVKSMGKRGLFKAQAAHEKHEMAAAMGKTHGAGTAVVGVGGKVVDIPERPKHESAVSKHAGVRQYASKPAAKFEEKRAFMNMGSESARVVRTNSTLGAYYSPDAPQPTPHIVTYGMYRSALRGGSAHHHGTGGH
jgi:hypothetical protein